MIDVRKMDETRKNLKTFVKLQREFYKDDDNFVMPLVGDRVRILRGRDNELFKNGDHAFFLAYRKGRPVGRLLVGIDESLNRLRNINQGYLSMFECENSQDTADRLFDAAADWLHERGIDAMTGPYSPNYDDFDKGMLFDGFDGPPVLFNPYNPEYYVDLFANAGFEKEKDHFAYYFKIDDFNLKKYETTLAYAMNKFGYEVEPIHLKGEPMERDIKAITQISAEGMPEEWDQLRPPTEDDVRDEFMQLKGIADPELVYIARVGGRPVGWIMAMPNYSEVLKKMNGRMLPTGFLRFLFGRKNIRGMRIIVLFVVPEYQNKACTGVLMYHLYKAAIRKGYEWGEGSTVDETNLPSMLTVQKAGGRLYRTYRVYSRQIG